MFQIGVGKLHGLGIQLKKVVLTIPKSLIDILDYSRSIFNLSICKRRKDKGKRTALEIRKKPQRPLLEFMITTTTNN